jgi:hypothetical protein
MNHPDQAQPLENTRNSMPVFSAKIQRAYAGVEDSLPVYLATHYPHILEQIDNLWPSPATVKYLDDLVLSDRNTREGFHVTAIKELLFLKQLHQLIFSGVSVESMSAFDKHRIATLTPPQLVDLVENASVEASSFDAHQDAANSPSRPGYDPKWIEIGEVNALRTFWDRRKAGATPGRQKLGEILVTNFVLMQEELDLALEYQQKLTPSPKLGHVLSDLAMCAVHDIRKALSIQAGIAVVDLEMFSIDSPTAAALNKDLARKLHAVPVMTAGKTLFIAVQNPLSFAHKKDLEFRTGRPVELVHARASAINECLDRIIE